MLTYRLDHENQVEHKLASKLLSNLELSHLTKCESESIVERPFASPIKNPQETLKSTKK